MKHEKRNTENPHRFRLLITILVLVGQFLALGEADAGGGPLVDSPVTIGEVNITFK